MSRTNLAYKRGLWPDWLKMNVIVMNLHFRKISMNCIYDDSFNSMQFTKLETLCFYQVPVNILSVNAFRGLSNLKEIRLEHMDLHPFDVNILAPCKNLEIFTMSYCGPLKLLLNYLFGSTVFEHLYKIDIQDCHLNEHITAGTFSGLPNITELKLISTHIERIDSNSFDALYSTLKHLNLGMNKLSKLPTGIFEADKEIVVDLEGNPFYCDCEIEYLRKLIISKPNVQLKSIICQSPPEYANWNLKDCPSLCTNETDQLEENMESAREEDQLQEQRIEDESQTTTLANSTNSLTHQEYPQQNIETIKTFTLVCEGSRGNVIITKPSDDSLPSFKFYDDVLFINMLNTSGQLRLLEFESGLMQNGKNRIKCYSIYKKGMFLCKRKPKTNRMYRFCSVKKHFNTITPLDCIEWHRTTITNEMKLNAWIMCKDKAIIIAVVVVFAILSPFVGILIAILLIKLFPKQIRKQNQDVKEELSSMPEKQQTINRLRFAFFKDFKYSFLRNIFMTFLNVVYMNFDFLFKFI